jgi:hypothetical protein
MLQPFKQIILVLVWVGFFWGFHSSTEKSFSVENLETVESLESEKEDSKAEFEDQKFLSQDEKNFPQNEFLYKIASSEFLNFPKYFPEVPVSPPNV